MGMDVVFVLSIFWLSASVRLYVKIFMCVCKYIVYHGRYGRVLTS